MPDWAKRAIEVIVILLGVLGIDLSLHLCR